MSKNLENFKTKRLLNDKQFKCFKNCILIVPSHCSEQIYCSLYCPPRVDPEVKSVSELKIGIDLLKLPKPK